MKHTARLAQDPRCLKKTTGNAPSWCAPGMVAALLMVELIFCPAGRAQCSELRAGDAVWIRLLEPVSSYSSKAGDQIRAIVIQSPVCDGKEVLPQGTAIDGRIKMVKRVGLGLVHERASIDLDFDRLVPEGDNAINISARVVEIDNARESVKNGVIHGIRATDTPQGRITSRLAHLPTWNPYSSLALIAYRTAFPVFPEPEIFLPVGTDMRLGISESTALPPLTSKSEPWDATNDPETPMLDETLLDLPERTTTTSGQDADIVNVVLIGSQEQMNAAFGAAGWKNGVRTSTRSVLREFHAFLAFKNYPEAPVSKQLLDGKMPEVTWEKGLDSYAKREHLRVWNYQAQSHEANIWVGAFTRETGAALSIRHREFIHHIDADLDSGREMMIRDLVLAGCVEDVKFDSRPERARLTLNATGDWMRTDGSVAVVQLKNCSHPLFQFDEARDRPVKPVRPKSMFARYLRMQILSYRSDVIRGNIFYSAFDLTRMMYRAHHRNKGVETMARANSLPVAIGESTENCFVEPPLGEE